MKRPRFTACPADEVLLVAGFEIHEAGHIAATALDVGLIAQIAVQRTAGVRDLKELANCPRPFAWRILVTGMWRFFAVAMNVCIGSLQGELSSWKTPTGNCAKPSLRPAT